MSYWNRPYFPEWCGGAALDDYVTYDTMVRIAGSWAGIAHAMKAIANIYDWTHIVLLSDEDTTFYCWYGAKPFDEIFGHEANYTFTWLRFAPEPTDEQLDDILQQIRSHTRGVQLIRFSTSLTLFISLRCNLTTRNILGCDQSNYPLFIIFSYRAYSSKAAL